MTRRSRPYTSATEESIWRQVEILDSFWKGCFVVFAAPFADYSRDPASTSAAILSRYLASPGTVANEMRDDPEKFGLSRPLPRAIISKLCSSNEGSVDKCAAGFAAAQEASRALDEIRLSHPRAFDELQRARRKRSKESGGHKTFGRLSKLVARRPNKSPK